MEKLAQKQQQNANKAIHANRNPSNNRSSSSQNGSKNGSSNKSGNSSNNQANGVTLSSLQSNGMHPGSQMNHYEPIAAAYDSYIGNNGGNNGGNNNYSNNYDQFQSSREFQDTSSLPFAKRLRSTTSNSGGFASMAMFFPDEFPASTLAMNYDEFSLAGNARRKSAEMCEGDGREHLADNNSTTSPGQQLDKSRYVAQFRAL